MISSSRVRAVRNRHGRPVRGVMLSPYTPGWKTRREEFDLMIVESVKRLRHFYPKVDRIEFAVEEVPSADPLPWEQEWAVLGRSFQAQRGIRKNARIVLYRLPISSRCSSKSELSELVYSVLLENLSNLLGIPPSQLDPNWG